MAHPELATEQAYVDYAYDCVERIKRQLARLGEAVDAPEYQAGWFEEYARSRLATFADVDRGLCFGKLDVDGAAASLYVGRRWVHEDDAPVVVNWQAPAARPFYTATVAEPQGVTLRRRFRVEGRRLLDLYDEPLDGSAADVVHGVADILLEELERSRDEHMRDIVATIQADQFALITREPEGVFVVQGGPGTGKTAVGLHRASWLLYTYRRELERSGVLVVGPNPVFMDYISHVLPTLGEERVEQRAIDALAGIEATRREKPELARRKSDVGIAERLAEAVHALPSPPDKLVGIRVDGAFLYLEPPDVAALIEEAKAAGGSHAERRERFRMLAARRLYEQYGRKLDDLAFRSFDELERALRTFLAKLVDSAWPRVKAEQLVRRVLAEEKLGGRGWSDADLPLIDEARALLDGPPQQHGHVIVDEAQDLTPMQLRMLARRSAGAMTILGDIAQAAGPVEYHRWEDLLPHLADGREVSVAELRLAYRVPRQVMELALPLLPLIAPDVAAPIAYRDGDEPPRFVQVPAAEVVTAAVREASAEAARDGRAALIAPAKLLPGLPAEADAAFDELATPFTALTPRAAKGLEFDRVVLVEPAAIAAEGAERIEGLRALYVALTRATKTLVVVHAKPLPPELAPASGRDMAGV
ncbi:MAG: HelD family protein [Gaiellaceae bacterium]